MTAASTETRFTVSYFIKPNGWPGTCAACGEPVPELEGFIQRDRLTRKWQVVCPSCVLAHGRFLPRVAGGNVLHSLDLAHREPVPTGHCCRCGAEVGLVKSRRSGKWYLAMATRSRNWDSDAWRIVNWEPHRCPDTLEVAS